MGRVKTLSDWFVGCSTKASNHLSLIAACQLERWAMDFAASNNLLVLGFVSTLGTMDRLSPLMDKSAKKPLRNRLFLSPSEIEALPSFIHKIGKRVEQKWFDFSIEDRKELFNIAEGFLVAVAEKGGGEEQSGRPPRLSFRYFCFSLSLKWACFVTKKNLKEDILKAFQGFCSDVLDQAVQDDALVSSPQTFPLSGESKMVKGKRRRPALA